MAYRFGKISEERMKGLNINLINILLLAIRRTPIDFGIAWKGGLRNAEEQNELFKQGYSKCDGYTLLSKHQSGNAVEVHCLLLEKFV